MSKVLLIWCALSIVVVSACEMSNESRTVAEEQPVGEQSLPHFEQREYAFEVAETVPVGHLVGAVVASDGDTGSIEYSLENNPDDMFGIDGMGQIRVVKPIPAGVSRQVIVQVRAKGRTGEVLQPVSITIGNVNQLPEIGNMLSVAVHPETVPAGTVLYALKAHDTDGDAIVYSIVLQSNAGYFMIDSAGIITLTKAYMIGAGGTERLIVRVEDATGYVEREITIMFSDENQAPLLNLDMYHIQIAENSLIGGSFAELGIVDPDEDTITYSLTGSVDFSIQDGRLVSTRRFDYESDTHTHQATLIVEDGKGGGAQAPLEIEITDVDEPPAFYDDDGNLIDTLLLSIEEAAPVGQHLAGIIARDPEDEQVQFGVFDSTTTFGATDGRIILERVLSHARIPSYLVQITATEADGTHAVTLTATITVLRTLSADTGIRVEATFDEVYDRRTLFIPLPDSTMDEWEKWKRTQSLIVPLPSGLTASKTTTSGPRNGRCKESDRQRSTVTARIGGSRGVSSVLWFQTPVNRMTRSLRLNGGSSSNYSVSRTAKLVSDSVDLYRCTNADESSAPTSFAGAASIEAYYALDTNAHRDIVAEAARVEGKITSETSDIIREGKGWIPIAPISVNRHVYAKQPQASALMEFNYSFRPLVYVYFQANGSYVQHVGGNYPFSVSGSYSFRVRGSEQYFYSPHSYREYKQIRISKPSTATWGTIHLTDKVAGAPRRVGNTLTLTLAPSFKPYNGALGFIEVVAENGTRTEHFLEITG